VIILLILPCNAMQCHKLHSFGHYVVVKIVTQMVLNRRLI
jgi:hypothetical protein